MVVNEVWTELTHTIIVKLNIKVNGFKSIFYSISVVNTFH